MRLLVLVFSSSVFVVEMCKQRSAFVFFLFLPIHSYEVPYKCLAYGLWPYLAPSPHWRTWFHHYPHYNLIYTYWIYRCTFCVTIVPFQNIMKLWHPIGFTLCQFICLNHLSLLSKTKARMMNTFFFFIIILVAACKKY